MAVKKVVLIQGAFDVLHSAHIRAFKFAKDKGDYLIVALNTDQLIHRYKTRECIIPFSQRKIMIAACRYVDKVIPASDFSPLKLLKEYKVSVYVLSREWRHTKDVELAYMKKVGGLVCFSPRSRTVSSSAIKERLLKAYQNGTPSPQIQRAHKPSPHRATVGTPKVRAMPPTLVTVDGKATGAVRKRKPGSTGTRIPIRDWPA